MLGAVVIVSAGEAARAKRRWWHRHQRPHRSCRGSAFGDERTLGGTKLLQRAVWEDDGLLVLNEIKRVFLEARLSQIGKVPFRKRAETVRVASTLDKTKEKQEEKKKRKKRSRR